MQLTFIFHRIEILFWTTVIPLMKESRRLGQVIQETYTQAVRFYQSPFRIQAVTLSVLGLFLGIAIGLGSTSLVMWLIP